MANIQRPDFQAIGREILNDAVTYAAVTGLNFFKESFEKKGWTDNGFTAWPETKGGRDGGSILTSTGYLRDSLQIVERSPERIEYAATAIYAGIHNEGGIIAVRVTEKARRFFWAMYYRNVDNSTGKMWKAMALTKKSFLQVKIPKRQFIGESRELIDKLDEWIIGQITTRFNQAI